MKDETIFMTISVRTLETKSLLARFQSQGVSKIANRALSKHDFAKKGKYEMSEENCVISNKIESLKALKAFKQTQSDVVGQGSKVGDYEN